MDATRYKDELVDVFNRNADVYDRSVVEFFKPIGRRLVELAGIRAGENVLDVGCGQGACLFPTAGAAGPSGHVTGIDLSTGMLGHLREEVAQRALGNVSLQIMDAEHPDFPPASFDAVLGSFSFVLLPDPPAALRAYPALLRPTGRLAFSGPAIGPEGAGSFLPPSLAHIFDAASEQFFAAWAPPSIRDGVAGWLGDPDRLTTSLREAGFAAVEIHDEQHAMTMRSGEDWVRWSWTNGMRLFWEHTPEADRDRLQAGIVAELDELRDENGTITVHHPVRYVVARL